jgi:hypothetical protein
MQLNPIRPNDIVLCDIRGQRFFATVKGKVPGKVSIMPIQNGYNFYSATARQIKGHYRRAKGSA